MTKKNSKYVADSTLEHLKGVKIKTFEDQPKYTRTDYVLIYKGYDFLENLLVVRTYIQKHYNIDWQALELLLKLMGMRVFTISDYTSLPKDYTYSRFKNVREKGWIQVIQEHPNAAHSVYGLSTIARNMCTNFYKMLAGEKPIPEIGRENPMAKKKGQKAFDKKKMEIIKKLNQLPTKPHFKKLYDK